MSDVAFLATGKKHDAALIVAGEKHLANGSCSTPLFVNDSHFMEALKSVSSLL